MNHFSISRLINELKLSTVPEFELRKPEIDFFPNRSRAGQSISVVHDQKAFPARDQIMEPAGGYSRMTNFQTRLEAALALACCGAGRAHSCRWREQK